MEKRPPLKKLRNRCISCAYLYIPRELGSQAQEVRDKERWGLLDKALPTEEYKCYKGWVIENFVEATCPAKEWKAHKDDIHPITAEKHAKESMDKRRWLIGIFLSGIILLLMIISLYFQYCSAKTN